MNLKEELYQFYKNNNLPQNGGVEFSTFEVPLPFFTLKLPNYNWRKRMLYIHDLEHIVNKQNTSWEGEMFIASWEIATGFWKNFPLVIFPLWTMGSGIWKHPRAVIQGFQKGNNDTGIANLNIPKEIIMEMTLPELKELVNAVKTNKSNLVFSFKFCTWLAVSQIVVGAPLIAAALIVVLVF